MKFGFSKKAEHNAQLGINITAEGIAVVCMDLTTQATGSPRVRFCQYTVAPKKGDQIKVLMNLVKTQKLIGVPTVCILNASQYDVFLIEEPEVLPEELISAVRWKVKDYVEYPIGEAVIDYMPIPMKSLNEKGKMGYAIVVKQTIVDEMVQFLSSVGLQVIAVDIPESAVCAVTKHLKESTEGLLCFRLLPGLSQIMLLKAGVILLMRNVDLNQEYLLNDKPDVEKKIEDKEKLVNDMALEIQRSIEYSVENLKQEAVKKVIFMPMNSALEPLMAELKAGLGIGVRVMQLSEIVSGLPKMVWLEQGQCLAALGGALREKAG